MSVIGSYPPHLLYGDVVYHHRDQHHHHQIGGGFRVPLRRGGCGNARIGRRDTEGKIRRRMRVRVEAMWPDLSGPSVVEMEPINDSEHLDQILLHAHHNSQSILIDWMAAWCRKCIYLKPKLERLAAEYDSNKVKFYCVDVNKVPQTLVKRGNISKMPTIQLWKDGEMKAEVIGGHKAWLVIEEVRQMIDKFV